VHNSHLQVLSEEGFAGFTLWVLAFVYAFWICLRMRFSAIKLPGLAEEDRTYFMTMSTAFAASMVAFLVGGTFIAVSNNDLTWMTFGAVAALDRLYKAHAKSLTPASVAPDRAAAVIPRARRKAIA
jgi:O-antigen ligase